MTPSVTTIKSSHQHPSKSVSEQRVCPERLVTEQRVEAPSQSEPIKVFQKITQKLPKNIPVNTNWQKRFLRPTTSRMKRSYRARAADYLYTQSLFALPSQFTTLNHIYNDSGSTFSLGKLLQGDSGTTRWTSALSIKLGRLA